MGNKKVSVILPTYNEKDNIKELIRQIYFYCGADLFEVIVVDDNSPDGTSEIVENLQKKYKYLYLYRRLNKRGLASAIWFGVEKARGNIVIWLDCDLSHPPMLIPKMLGHIPQYDVVCASRYVEGGEDKRSFIRAASSKGIGLLANLVLRLNIKDVTSGFYAVKKEVFSNIQLMKTGYAEYCIRFSYDLVKKGYKVREVGYIFSDREKGYSKTSSSLWNYIYYGYLCFKEIMKLRIGR